MLHYKNGIKLRLKQRNFTRFEESGVVYEITLSKQFSVFALDR